MGKSSQAAPPLVRGVASLILITATIGLVAQVVYGVTQAVTGSAGYPYVMAMLTLTGMNLLLWFVFVLIGTALLNGRRDGVLWLALLCILAGVPLVAALVNAQTRASVLSRADFWAAMTVWAIYFAGFISAVTKWEALSG